LDGRHGVIQGYKVLFHKSEDYPSELNLGLPETKLTNERELILHGLRKWTNYSVSVLAFTSVGDGKASVSIICRTDEDGKNKSSRIIIRRQSHKIIVISLPS